LQIESETENKKSSEDLFEKLHIDKDYDAAIKTLNKNIKIEKNENEKVHLKG
jgi:hypothetical protein